MTIPQFTLSPEATDILADSQDDLLQNFEAMQAAWTRNHVDFNIAGESGKHNLAELVQSNAEFNVAKNEIIVYSKFVDGQTVQTFLRFQNNGLEVQLSNWQFYQLGSTSFITSLPGGYVLYFGTLPLQANIINIKVNPQPANIVTFNFLNNDTVGLSFPFAQIITTDTEGNDIPAFIKYYNFTSNFDEPPEFFYYWIIGQTIQVGT